MFFRVQVFLSQVFLDSGFSESRFFRVQVFQDPDFSESRFSWVQVFQGLGPGSGPKVWVQVLEVANFKNTFFYRTPPVAASVKRDSNTGVCLWNWVNF